MKRTAILFLFMAIHAFAFAQHAIQMNARQDTTILFSGPGYSTDPLRATWDKKVEQKEGLWILKLYDRKKTLREQISFADQKLEIRQGPYYFYENGVVSTEGSYEKGYKNGPWQVYNAEGKLIEQSNFRWDQLTDKYTSYWANGKIKREGAYAKNNKIGSWILYHQDGKIALEEIYNGEGELVKEALFPMSGSEVKQLPSYPGGMAAFDRLIARKLRYPENAVKNKIQGTVILSLLIRKDGTVGKAKVKESLDPELSAEAIRVIRTSTNWIPGKLLGEAVDMQVSVPVKFSLEN